ncbi:MAG: hypothetical protein [Malazfec virus 5]
METQEKSQSGILASATGSASSLDKNTEIMEQREVKDTPFRLTGNEEQGWVATLGMYRVSEPEMEAEKLEKWLRKSNNWELLTNVISVVVEETLKARVRDEEIETLKKEK